MTQGHGTGPRTCPTCNGGGLVEKMGLRGIKVKTCPTCQGSGRV